MPNILAVAETRGGELRKVALEAVTAARALADAAGGGEVHALVFGPPGTGGKTEPLAQHGADKVLVCEHAAYGRSDAESMSATIAARAAGFAVVLLSASAQGKDLAPRVSAKLNAPLLSDCLAVRLSDGSVVVTHPTYTGKVIATLKATPTPVVVSIRPNAVTPAAHAKPLSTETIAPAADPAASRVKVTEVVVGSGAKLDLGEAPVIISGGRGLKEAANFKLVEDLADAFGNAAVGATRAVTDDGWRPHSDQIGQTGRLVSPDLYVAVGISGAIQHLAGMRTSKTIVAINKDAEAPIFKVADYGIVGDALEIVPVFTAAVRAAKQSH
ncbi:MAG: electron transfer flavoprotein subunit alpha/FixB family protein [Gemmatimonadaceae bacterium]|nr:electron transfer flavoprotein subunit alpha/FixB family protein [Gemmatimonadaceae bacterium]